MGIINVTPDSFYSGSRSQDASRLLQIASDHISQGTSIIDVGACSTRPNAEEVCEKEEWNRLEWALRVLRSNYPDLPISVDTFRIEIAERAIKEFHIDIINDVSGGNNAMYALAATAHTPYVLTCALPLNASTPLLVMGELIDFFQSHLDSLYRMGISDVILDPGFGFAKTQEQNYIILRHLNDLQLLNLPILVGLSRKSMIYKTLQITPEEALNGTTAAHMIALEQGAAILRVHDTKEAQQTIQIYNQSLC